MTNLQKTIMFAGLIIVLQPYTCFAGQLFPPLNPEICTAGGVLTWDEAQGHVKCKMANSAPPNKTAPIGVGDYSCSFKTDADGNILLLSNTWPFPFQEISFRFWESSWDSSNEYWTPSGFCLATAKGVYLNIGGAVSFKAWQ